MADVCTICHEELTTGTQCALPECGHLFHATCVLAWFRHGMETCPNCRATPEELVEHLPGITLMARASHMRKCASRRDAPQALREQLRVLERSEADAKRVRDKLLKFRRDNRQIFATVTQMRKQLRRARRAAHRERALLGALHVPGMQELPPLVIRRAHPRWDDDE